MTLTEKIRTDESAQGAPGSGARARAKKLRQKLHGGSLTMLAGSGLVGVTSLIYNVLTADQKAQLPTVLASMKAQAQARRAA